MFCTVITTIKETNPSQAAHRKMADWEFIALTAFMMSLVALSIDMMLPALPQIGADLGVANDNDRQAILTTFMAGLTVMQFFYGPLSDKTGRKPVVAVGTAIFLVGSIISALSQDFNVMLAGRFLQGCGIAAMRILSVTIVRDIYEGRAMARIMSMAMSLFILVPCVAPLLGQLIISVSHWRMIFVLFCLAAGCVFFWFMFRQVETLDPSRRRDFNIRTLQQGLLETCRHPVTLGYTLASGVVGGAFSSYLFTAQQIFQDVFRSGEKFAMYFAILAVGFGVASLMNARLVGRFGMKRICYVAIGCMILTSTLLVISALVYGSNFSLTLFMSLMMVIFFCISFMFGNMNAIAMQPLGHMAGTAASVISLINGALSLMIGAYIGQSFNGTIVPFSVGYIVCSVITLVIMLLVDLSEKTWVDQT